MLDALRPRPGALRNDWGIFMLICYHARMSEETMTDHVTVEAAGKLTGISSRTLRHWIASGKLSTIAGKRGKLVSMGEVEHLARLVGKSLGNSTSPENNPATVAEGIAGNVADSSTATVLVSAAARLQLATIRDEWLAPLVARIGELERENGRLTAATAAKDETISELRRRAAAAEAEVAQQEEREAEPAQSMDYWIAKAVVWEREHQAATGLRRSGSMTPASLRKRAVWLQAQAEEQVIPRPTWWHRLLARLRGAE